MTDLKNKKRKLFNPAVLSLIGTILIRGFAGSGINMSASLFLSPVSESLGVGVGVLSIFFSIASLVMLLWLPFAGKLLEKYKVRTVVIIAGIFQCLSFASLGLFSNVAFWYVMTVPQTLGAVILVNLLGPILIHRHFPKKTGRVLGIQMSLVWAFAAVLQPIVSYVIEDYGWRSGYFFMGLSALAVILFSATVLLKDKSDEEKENKPTRQALMGDKTKYGASFYMLLIFTIALTGAAVFTQHIPNYGELLGFSALSLGTAMACSSVGSALGALAIGFLSEKIGALKTCYGIITLWLAAVFGFVFCKQSFTIFAVSCFVHGICSSSIAIISPILTIAFYNKEQYEKIYAKVAMGAPIASILLIPAYGFVYDAFHSYAFVLIALSVLLLIAGVAIFWGYKKRKNSSPTRA